MLLHKLILNPRCREVRRDLVSPYEMHSTLCRAFSIKEEKCPAGAFLWRLELSQNGMGTPHVLVQSNTIPDWTRIGVDDWLVNLPDVPLYLNERLCLDKLSIGQRFRFRLRANPCVSIGGKRQGLMYSVDQEQWIVRKGLSHGFELPKLTSFSMDATDRPDIMISQAAFLRGSQRSGHQISIYSVQFDGILLVTDVDKFLSTLQSGIGHGKSMGLGLLSVLPIV
jgi:CRISPR system Cascade subunit CasE